MKNGTVFVLIALLAVIYSANLGVTAYTLDPLREKLAAQKEADRPAELEMIIIEKECRECSGLSDIVGFLENSTNLDKKSVEYDSQAGSSLISEYGITKLPALVITGEIGKENIAQVWQSLGGNSRNDAVIVEGVPPYYDTNENRVRGLVKLILLNDSSCGECYDVSINRNILSTFGISIAEELTYDISSPTGKELVKEYNITKVPTFMISSEASVYSSLMSVWPNVGTAETDGYYVFRNPEAVQGTYRDLSNNAIIKN